MKEAKGVGEGGGGSHVGGRKGVWIEKKEDVSEKRLTHEIIQKCKIDDGKERK